MTILVTGGSGYIGTHTCVELLVAGYDVLVVDNFSNSEKIALEKVEEIAGRSVKLFEIDIRNEDLLSAVFKRYSIEAVIHFAGSKAVFESIENPLTYYDNNVGGTISLCKVMSKYGVKNIIFSSSATVYGIPKTVPIYENFPVSATNPYGRSKLIIENFLKDIYIANPDWKIGLLRYFNPVGAHESGLIGESPLFVPSNLMPYLSQVAIGNIDKIKVFGGDYSTKDGTCVRDYIHVSDLAIGHVKALEYLQSEKDGCELTVNLGTGKGTSVLEMIESFRQVINNSISYEVVGRRQGDVPVCYAAVELALEKLDWKTNYDISKMCEDTWNWQKKNPNGYS